MLKTLKMLEMMKFKRVYHPFDKWEEVPHGMWSPVEDKKLWLEKAIVFTGNYKLYGSYMLRVISEWPISCENALTDNNLNKKAWVGHAACALGIGCPEHITREAWGYLTYEQQLLANKEADRAIWLWSNNYSKNKGIRDYMDKQMLFQWDS